MPRKGTKLTPEAAAKNNAAITRWKLENTENLSICLRKGKRDAYKKLAAIRGVSVSSMIQDYMDAECRAVGIDPQTGEVFKMIANSEGKQYRIDEWPAIVNMMDDELREEVHRDLAPCTEQEFFSAYAAAHLSRFGEQWELDKKNPIW